MEEEKQPHCDGQVEMTQRTLEGVTLNYLGMRYKPLAIILYYMKYKTKNQELVC
jgi:hypothetical protein